jgi:hypothetical protein
MQKQRTSDMNRIDRRGFLGLGLGLTAAAATGALLPGAASAGAQVPKANPSPLGRRRLGSLEVSALGLGVQNMSRKYETTVPYRPDAQIALAWLMAQKPWIVPIPGTTQMAHMVENNGAAAVRFTPSELAELNASVSAIQIQGQRLPDQVLIFSDVEAPPKKGGART